MLRKKQRTSSLRKVALRDIPTWHKAGSKHEPEVLWETTKKTEDPTYLLASRHHTLRLASQLQKRSQQQPEKRKGTPPKAIKEPTCLHAAWSFAMQDCHSYLDCIQHPIGIG
ncbi:Hypothetical predicted protein [Pelobates cultripes]|uniref:Uncharacterized protein n=1 Tax=Pelobates cultripes TaxID=61616 RepID=A0AAD1S5K7_PELCU|nr:Hypothetical predicted protein [Pelobates cultripes]